LSSKIIPLMNGCIVSFGESPGHPARRRNNHAHQLTNEKIFQSDASSRTDVGVEKQLNESVSASFIFFLCQSKQL
jgi:hypothetical protein